MIMLSTGRILAKEIIKNSINTKSVQNPLKTAMKSGLFISALVFPVEYTYLSHKFNDCDSKIPETVIDKPKHTIYGYHKLHKDGMLFACTATSLYYGVFAPITVPFDIIAACAYKVK